MAAENRKATSWLTVKITKAPPPGHWAHKCLGLCFDVVEWQGQYVVIQDWEAEAGSWRMLAPTQVEIQGMGMAMVFNSDNDG